MGHPSFPPAPRRADAVDWEPLLERALRGEGVAMVYQPIVDLQRLVTVGYEALSRFSGPPGLTPDRWFAAAERRGVLPALEAATLRLALAGRPSMPANCFLTVNVEPESLLSAVVTEAFASAGDLRGVVVEVTEHRPIVEREATQLALAALRRAGALVAVDDAGTGYAGLQQILELRPGILKLDRVLVAGVDRDEAKAALIEMLGVFANKIDAWLLAEGIETEGEARRLVELGVPLAQGYYFARPAPPWATVAPGLADTLGPQADRGEAGTLRPLVETAPWVTTEGIAAASQRLRQGEAATIVVVDRDQRPVSVLTREALARGESPVPLSANVHSSGRELAHRLATRRPPDTATPVLVTDNAGRYVGVVTIPRLLASLAGG